MSSGCISQPYSMTATWLAFFVNIKVRVLIKPIACLLGALSVNEVVTYIKLVLCLIQHLMKLNHKNRPIGGEDEHAGIQP